MKQGHRWIGIGFTVLSVCVIGISLLRQKTVLRQTEQVLVSSTSSISTSVSTSVEAVVDMRPFQWPVERASERVTKKAFGLRVSPANSPVTPERFTGYHTGVDFEAFPEEAEIDVPVRAICQGKLLVKRIATGYGGLAVQACKLNEQPITVVYGHVRLESIGPKVGDELKSGEYFAVLGKGFSTETDGERKHLHLGIHRGSLVSILGYTPRAEELRGWIDALSLFRGTK